MAGVYEMYHKGKNIICLDIADLDTKDKNEFNEHIELAKQRIRKMPEKSSLIITNVSNIRFDADMANSIKKYAEHNTPYVKASAIVGLSGLQKIIFLAVKSITGRDFYLAKSVDEAKDWLVQQ